MPLVSSSADVFNLSGSSFCSWTNCLSMPIHCSLGKYVPAKIGFPSGNVIALSGHPPLPLISCAAVI